METHRLGSRASIALAVGLWLASGAAQGTSPAAPPPMPSETYFVILEGRPEGPYALNDLRGIVAEGRMIPETLVWNILLEEWTRAGLVEAVAMAFGTEIDSPDTLGAYLLGRWHSDSTVFIELETTTIHSKVDYTRTYYGNGTFVSAGTSQSLIPDWRGELRPASHGTTAGSWVVLPMEGEAFRVRTFESTQVTVAASDYEEVSRSDTVFDVEIIDENTFSDGYITWKRVQ